VRRTYARRSTVLKLTIETEFLARVPRVTLEVKRSLEKTKAGFRRKAPKAGRRTITLDPVR
jgi:hypothetical protein